MKKTIVAYRLAHVEYYIRQVLKEPRSNFRIVLELYMLNDIGRGKEVTFVQDRAYRATDKELQDRALITELCAAREFVVHEVWI